MYEMRQKKRKEMMQKWWFYYVLLAFAIFLFSQSSIIIKSNMMYALPAVLISFIMHTRSVGNLTQKVLKIEFSIVANIAMLVTLSIITILCYFKILPLYQVILMDLSAISIYIIIAAICSKFKIGE